MDCVAIRAGKQEALEYIRSLFNIPLNHCAAAGDSGNDILMLEGKHIAPVICDIQSNKALTLRVLPCYCHAVPAVGL